MASFMGFQYATPLTVSSNQPEVVTDTLSLRRVVSSTDAQRWEMQIPLVPDAYGSANLVNTIQVHREMSGGHTAFAIAAPQPLNTDPTFSGAISTLGAHTAGTSTVLIAGTATFNIPAGRFITFGSTGKLYRVTTTAVSSGGASTAINIFPALVADVAGSTELVHTGVNMQARYENQGGLVSYTLNQGVVDRLTISVVEAL